MTKIFGNLYLNVNNDVHIELTVLIFLVGAQPVKKKAKKHSISDSVRAQEPLHVQKQREYEERLRREAREEQKEDRASLMAMWKEMMEFQGNLLKEFVHRPSLPSHPSYHRHALHNQGCSSFPSTGYMAPYDSPRYEHRHILDISYVLNECKREKMVCVSMYWICVLK